MISVFWRAYESGAVVSYCVHEPPDPPEDHLERAERFVFLKDGFSVSAALGAPFWLTARGQWLALVGYILVAFAVVMGLSALGVQPFWILLGLVGLHVLVGAEAASIQRWTLEQRDWNCVGTVVGRNSRDCERRFFDTWFANRTESNSTHKNETQNTVPTAVQPEFGQPPPLGGQGVQSDRLTERLRHVFVDSQ